jgi:hypothetical protein
MSLEKTGPSGDEPTRLSLRQKRDLVELVAAGVMSAVFFTAPVFLVREARAVKPQVTPIPDVAPVREASPMPPLESVRVLTTDVTAPVSIPELQRTPAVVHAMRWTATPAPRTRRSPVAARGRLPLGRRIARLFAGDGTHTVQPFPTIPATER